MYAKGILAKQKSYGFWNLEKLGTRVHKNQNPNIQVIFCFLRINLSPWIRGIWNKKSRIQQKREKRGKEKEKGKEEQEKEKEKEKKKKGKRKENKKKKKR